jgi:FimV-like protein
LTAGAGFEKGWLAGYKKLLGGGSQGILMLSAHLPFSLKRSRARHLAPLLAAGALLYSGWAAALGLGDITTRSSLNQPFNADIELLDTAGIEADELAVGLASAEAFSRAGLDRPFYLNDLRFSTDFRGPRKVIHVTSSKAITEPYVSFMVQVTRPNGQLLRAFTVLLDPPGPASQVPPPLAAEAPLQAQRRNPAAQPAAAAAPRPAATQDKRYQVGPGENLWSIGKRLQAAGSPQTTTELVRDIKALNPGNAPLKAGQSLLLPDSAVLPGSAAAAPASPAAATPAAPEQLAATVLQNEQLQKDLSDLQARLQGLETQVADKDKQVAQLQTQLAEVKPAPAVAPAAAAAQAPVAPAAPVPTPVAVQPVGADDGFSLLTILGALAALLLLLALLLLARRRRLAQQPAAAEAQPSPLFKPAQAPVVAAAVAPVVAQPAPALQALVTDVAPRREAPAATDALDGASIYIAYGRFNEALGILREGLAKQPERTDLHVRVLEVLGQQGDAKGFAEEYAALQALGFSELKLEEIKARYPKVAAPAAAVVAPPLAEPEPLPVVIPVVPPAEPAPASPAPEPAADEFQLNLDDLSMDADWDLVSPFDPAPPPRAKAPEELHQAPPAVDPEFASNLKEFPEVFEMPDEQFLSDFADVEDEPFLQLEEDDGKKKDQDTLDNDFLDSFIADADLPELDALTVDFDSLESQQASAEKLDQAQACIDQGDLQGASDLLYELLREGDDSCKQAARQLLSQIA